MTSTTFIRSEIGALEDNGLEILRYAVRRWEQLLVDPNDVSEQTRTHYLLTGNILGLVTGLLKEIVLNPGGLYKAMKPWISLLKNQRGDIIRHAAYLMQSVYLRQRARVDRIQHIHVHFSTNAAAVAMLCKALGGPTYSFTAHGPDEFESPAKISLTAKIRHATFVVAISDYCKRTLLANASDLDHPKIQIVRCGINLRDFTLSDATSDINNTLVCVGRLCPQKGQHLIPQIASRLRTEFPRLKFVLIGDGESRAAIERSIQKYEVKELVKLEGWLPNEEARRMIAASRALILPSYSEGLPIVIIEALALGRPVISTRIAAIPELVDESCGWIAPAGNIELLVSAVRSALLSSPLDLAVMGAEGRRRVERLHDRTVSAAALRQFLQKP
jgi:colanic acid/amylovoran biosynthesis glycosyltransferase